MELYQLEAFEAIVAERSFTRAAEALHVSQPAITRQIAALEREMQVRLFDRMGRTVGLTAAGEALHRYAEPMLRSASEALQAVAEIRTGEGGRLAVGASSTVATYVLPSILRRYRERHPKVDISVHTGVSARVVQMVQSNEVELGLVTGDVRDPELDVTGLAAYDTCVVVPRGHALADRISVAAGELEGIPLILMESGTNLRAYVDRLLSAAGVAEQVAMELDNVEAIKRMIEAGLGVSMLPEVSVRAEVETGRLVALSLADVPTASRRIAMVHRRGRYVSAALRALMALMERTMQNGDR